MSGIPLYLHVFQCWSKMSATTVKQILTHRTQVGAAVILKGWLRSRRTSKGGFSFLHLHDGSCFDTIQAVADQDLANYAEIVELGTGCSVIISGTVVDSDGSGQDREIQASRVEIVGLVDDPETYPISKKQHTFEYLRSVTHLQPRTNTFVAISRLRHRIETTAHQ